MMAKRVLFFSRGRGHGHAIPDMAIAKEIAAQSTLYEIKFASYATGADTFRAAGVGVHDLQLPERNAFIPTLAKIREFLRVERPDIIVAHEEFSALLAAAEAGLPSIFISAWLPISAGINTETLSVASSIVVLGEPGILAHPPGLKSRPIYTGYIMREMKCTVADRAHCRAKMGVSPDAFVVVVVPGGGSNEEHAPVVDKILQAFRKLEGDDNHLWWASMKDSAHVRRHAAGLERVRAIEYCDPIEEILAAADVVITKGSRGITLDCASLGVPSISLSTGLNPIDDLLVPRIGTNISLVAAAVDGEILLHYLKRIRRMPAVAPSASFRLGRKEGARRAAGALLDEMPRLLDQP